MTTGKAIALTVGTFVSKAMTLLFNMLSIFVIDLLQRSKCLLTSQLQLPSTVVLEPKKIVCNHIHFFAFGLPFGTPGLRQGYIGFHMGRSDTL